MVEERTSKQNIGNMFMNSTEVGHHHYCHESIELSLSRYIEIILNILMEEAISENNLSEKNSMI